MPSPSPPSAGPHEGRRRRARIGLAGAAAGLVLLASAAPATAGALLPERGGSPNADRIASLYTVILVIAGIVFTGVTSALVYALVRYNRRRSPIAVQSRGHTRLEIGWTLAATALIVFIAAFSLTKLDAIDNPDRALASPAAAAALHQSRSAPMTIRVVGRQYIWMYRYPNGAISYEEMVAPVGVTVKLDIVSRDVAHSWWIPKLGGKFDAIPGYTNHTWFRAERPGVYRGQCAELCGRNHADMRAQVRAVEPAQYEAWADRQRRLVGAADARDARDHRARSATGGS